MLFFHILLSQSEAPLNVFLLQYIIIFASMVFRSMLGRVLGGLTNFSPVKNLIKYIIDRSLNELLSDQVALEDFRNGELLLTNIGLNLEKINRDYLLSSPYILHQGRIRQLRVTMPGWSELSTRSIEVAAEGVHIDLKPNKRFADNFKEAMRQQSAEISQQAQPGELDESNPLDFFRQLVKQIILNMKITIQNTVVRLFMNEPTGEASAKPQYYLMFRLPLLAIGKSEEQPLKPQQQESEQISFNLQLPQLSLHLLKQGADIPEYANQKVDKSDFPFVYPPVYHPSTILLLGQAGGGECSTRLKVTLTTLFKQQRRLLVIQGRVGHLQTTIDPIQIKILTRFIAQLRQFQRILKSVMAELGLGQAPLGLTLSRKDSKGKSGNHDFFSSMMMMSISQPLKPTPSAQIGIYNNMMQSPEMVKAATEFNQNAVDQLRKSGNLQESGGWKNISFKQEIKILFQLQQLQANFPKYVTAAAYERRWAAEKEGSDRVNESLGCSHFRLSVRGVRYQFNSGSNLHEIRLKMAKLEDARLKNQQSYHHSVSEEFYELDSSTFYNTDINQDYFTRQPELLPYKLGSDQHYCLQELFRLSEGRDPQVATARVKTYAFMPTGAACGEGAGLCVSFNGDGKCLRVQVKEVAVMLNFEIWKDVLNIVFPVFLYRKLHQKINLQTSNLPNPSENTRPLDLFESQYRFSGNLVEESEERQQRVQVRVKVGLIYCFYRETAALKPKQNLFQEVERKILDSDNFSKGCFCQLTERGLYAELRESEWQQIGEQFNLAVKQVKAGLLSVTSSRIEEDVKPILIVQGLRVEESKVEVGSRGEQLLRSRTYVPKARLNVQLAALISFVDMAKRMVGVVDSLLAFKKCLSAKLLIIEQQLTNKPRSPKEKPQKQRVVEVMVGEVELKMLLISTFLRGFFFRKRGGGQQQLKLDALAIGLSRKLDIRLGQYKNQLLTQQYPLTEHYPSIRDTHLIIEIGRQAKARVFNQNKQVKDKKRLQRRLEFFSEVEKEPASLWVILKEKMDSGDKRASKDFRFEKARKNSVIEEEKRTREVNVLPLSLNIHAGNLAFLMRHQQQIENIFKQVGDVMTQIKEESRDIIERKDSIESEGETTTQICLNLKDIHLNIDIRPDFRYEPTSGLRIFSNTRMFVGVNIIKLNVLLNPDSHQGSLDTIFSINAHFLHHSDKDTEPNPLLLSPKELENLGFRRILDMSELTAKVDIKGKGGTIVVDSTVDTVKIQLCLTSLPLLQLFLDHFLRHTLAGEQGTTEDERFIVLDQAQEQEPEDITQKLQEYEKLLQEKRKAFQEYSMRQFAVRESEHPKLILKNFKVASLRVKLLGGHEFRFVEVNSLNESKASKRGRSETPDLLNYLSLTLDNLRLKAEQSERTQALVEIQRLELQLSYKRREGLLWGAEKDYSVHLLKINTPIKILVEMAVDYLKIKLSNLEITASLTDEVFYLADQFSAASKAAELSPWKRQYAEGQKVAARKMLLLVLPEGRITATAQFKRTKLLNERGLRLQELVVHQQQANSQRIGQIFHDWAMRIFTTNLGTLVSGALFEVLSACIGLLFGGVRRLLALFFPRLRE